MFVSINTNRARWPGRTRHCRVKPPDVSNKYNLVELQGMFLLISTFLPCLCWRDAFQMEMAFFTGPIKMSWKSTACRLRGRLPRHGTSSHSQWILMTSCLSQNTTCSIFFHLRNTTLTRICYLLTQKIWHVKWLATLWPKMFLSFTLNKVIQNIIFNMALKFLLFSAIHFIICT